jgi:hypothetical protein
LIGITSAGELEEEESPWTRKEGEATRTLRTSQKVAMSPPGAIVKKVILGQPPRSRLILLALSQPIIQRKGKLVQKIDG